MNFTALGDTLSRGVSGSATGSPLPSSPSTPTLSVSRSGSGSGTVTSSPSGISCGSDCTQTYTAGTKVTLTASRRVRLEVLGLERWWLQRHRDL